MKRCQHCAAILWPVRGLGRVCPKCDHLCCWATINRGAQCPRHPWTITPGALPATCIHCQRPIVLDHGVWIDPEATGDDSMWRETCDANDTFTAEHEPAPADPRESARTYMPATQFQDDVNEILRGTPFDWAEHDGPWSDEAL